MGFRHGFIPHVVCCGIVVLSLNIDGLPAALADDGFESTDLPIVLTASRMRQPLAEAPAAITVIDRKMIEQSGVRQIADILRLVPGAVVGYNDGNWPVATLGGLSSVYASGLQVLIDGVSVYSPVFGGMFWAELPISIDDIERIEVVRGPNAATYGANSFQGVVNIITRDSILDTSTEVNANIGGGGIGDVSLRFGGTQGSWHSRVTVGERSDDGFDSRPDSDRLRYANMKSNYRVDAEDSMDFVLRGANKVKQIGEYPPAPATNTPHDQTGDQLSFQMRWSHAESTDNEWWVQYYHQQDSQMDRFQTDVRLLVKPLALWPTALPYQLEEDFRSQRDGIEFQDTTRWSNQLRSVWGIEARRDGALSERLFGTNEEIASYLTRAFGNLEWRFASGWILNSGTMFERNSLATDGWSPRVALIHEIVPGQSVRISASTALRTPSLVESRGNFSFNIPLPGFPFNLHIPLITATGNVDSEKVRSKEVGYNFSFPQMSANGDVRWFSDRYSGLISYRGRTALVGGDAVNLNEARTTGVDLTLQWTPCVDTQIRLAAAHSHTTSTDIGGMYSTSVPNDTLSLLLSRSFAGSWTASANYQRVGSMFWVDAGQNKQSIPAIDHLNLRLAKRIKMGDHMVEVAGVIQNALGHYRDYYLGPLQGTPDNVADRIFFMQLKFDY